jgi:hypothetical protein
MLRPTQIGLPILILLITSILIMSPNHGQASQLQVSIVTNKPAYTYREKVTINGTIALNDEPSESLTGIQVNDPMNRTILTRTTQIGQPTNETVQLLSATPCNEAGVPISTFLKESHAHINVTVKSNAADLQSILITVCAFDNDSTPIMPEVMELQTVILPGGITKFKPDMYIETWVSTGPATFYVNVYSDWPKNGGHSYTPEKAVTFNITPTIGQNATTQMQKTSNNLTFRLPPEAPFGTYTINATAYAHGQTSFNSTTFTREYQVRGDVNFDYVVNILDIVMISRVFGSKSGAPDWNPEMDIQPDSKIDIVDIVTATLQYGTRYKAPANLLTHKNQSLSSNEGVAIAGTTTENPQSLHEPIAQAFMTGIDVYTQYPDGYNGKGLNTPSDMFWPQKQVCLYAYVAYNSWPQQQKTVAFQVQDPHGTTRAIFYNTTSENGITFVKCRLPWPCDNPEYEFGEWTVTGTADVGGTPYKDTLTFKYDYCLRIWPNQITTDKPSYQHEEMIHITVEYGTQSMQTFSALFTVTATDETGTPFAFAWTSNTVGQAQYSVYTNRAFTLNVYIPKSTFTGMAKLYVGALNDLLHGDILCPGCEVTAGIEPS